MSGVCTNKHGNNYTNMKDLISFSITDGIFKLHGCFCAMGADTLTFDGMSGKVTLQGIWIREVKELLWHLFFFLRFYF